MLPLCRPFASLLVYLILSACTGMGVEPPDTFEEYTAYAIATHTAVLQATTTALDFEEITSDQAADVAGLADRARSLIDSARAVYAAGDEPEATRQLAIATEILRQLQAYLRGDPT